MNLDELIAQNEQQEHEAFEARQRTDAARQGEEVETIAQELRAIIGDDVWKVLEHPQWLIHSPRLTFAYKGVKFTVCRNYVDHKTLHLWSDNKEAWNIVTRSQFLTYLKSAAERKTA
jgi:hypothetical protein